MATNRKTDKVEVFLDPMRLDMNEGEVLRVQINDEVTEYRVGEEVAISPQQASILKKRMGLGVKPDPNLEALRIKAQDPALN